MQNMGKQAILLTPRPSLGSLSSSMKRLYRFYRVVCCIVSCMLYVAIDFLGSKHRNTKHQQFWSTLKKEHVKAHRTGLHIRSRHNPRSRSRRRRSHSRNRSHHGLRRQVQQNEPHIQNTTWLRPKNGVDILQVLAISMGNMDNSLEV